MNKEKILEINHMKVSFRQYHRGFRQREISGIQDLSVKAEKICPEERSWKGFLTDIPWIRRFRISILLSCQEE